jgi:sterol desaturase/sphingolipid hydroxylase (fatty acid hydroxylase superfamily)
MPAEFEMLIHLVIFVSLGLVSWKLSKRMALAEYSASDPRALDVGFAVLSLAFIACYNALIQPLISAVIHAPAVSAGILSDIGAMPLALRWVCFFLLADFLGYWFHRWLHSAYLWRFHSFHHSPTKVNWLSGLRATPIHLLIVLSPAAIAGAVFLTEFGTWPMWAFVTFDILNQHFCHSSIRLPKVQHLERILVTPRMHFVHHNPDPRYTNSNYGLYLSVWDHLFNTYVDAEKIETKGQLGLDYQESHLSLLLGLNKRQSS